MKLSRHSSALATTTTLPAFILSKTLIALATLLAAFRPTDQLLFAVLRSVRGMARIPRVVAIFEMLNGLGTLADSSGQELPYFPRLFSPGLGG